jgi:hypothetical protein
VIETDRLAARVAKQVSRIGVQAMRGRAHAIPDHVKLIWHGVHLI